MRHRPPRLAGTAIAIALALVALGIGWAWWGVFP